MVANVGFERPGASDDSEVVLDDRVLVVAGLDLPSLFFNGSEGG